MWDSPRLETGSVSSLGFPLAGLRAGHASPGKCQMKKLLSLAALLLLPAICRADNSVVTTKNIFSFSKVVSTGAVLNPGWQIYNTSTNRKTIYLEKIIVGGDKEVYFTMYSTNTASGFTGTLTAQTAVGLDIGKGTSISSCSFTTGATVPTGDTIWQGVVAASVTYNLMGEETPIAIRPGKAIYIIGTKPLSGQAFVDFYFREEYAP